jgi:hypothetical protein
MDGIAMIFYSLALPVEPTQEEVDACNADRERDGDPPVTAQDIQDVRDQTPEE